MDISTGESISKRLERVSELDIGQWGETTGVIE